MNSMQLELDNINAQLELLTYRKTQLDSIMSEYSDVVNRIKGLVSSIREIAIKSLSSRFDEQEISPDDVRSMTATLYIATQKRLGI